MPRVANHIHYGNRRSNLPSTPTVRIVAPATDEGPQLPPKEISPNPSEDSDRGASYEVTVENSPSISQDEVKVAIQVASTTEAFTGCCFNCNKVRHHYQDIICK